MLAHRLLLLASFGFAQSVLAQAPPPLPQEFMKGLAAAQQREALEGLGQAQPPRCDNALECLVVATRDARLAFKLAREGQAAAQIAAALDQGDRREGAPDEVAQRAELGVPAYAPTRGPANAPVTIVSWVDFLCPFSERLAATFKQLEAEYPGKLRFVVRHLPLPFHEGASELALMSMAAHEQGRFWAFYDFAFDPGWDAPRSADAWAAQLRLDRAALQGAQRVQRYRERLLADEHEIKRLVESPGTPTSFVNGIVVVGAQPLETWRAHIDAELAALSPSRLGK